MLWFISQPHDFVKIKLVTEGVFHWFAMFFYIFWFCALHWPVLVDIPYVNVLDVLNVLCSVKAD